jgi:acyl carrier protein
MPQPAPLAPIKKKLSQIASRVTGDTNPEFSDDEQLTETGLLDSPGVIELTIWIEDEFGFSISEDEVTTDNLGSVTAISIFIGSKIS